MLDLTFTNYSSNSANTEVANLSLLTVVAYRYMDIITVYITLVHCHTLAHSEHGDCCPCIMSVRSPTRILLALALTIASSTI